MRYKARFTLSVDDEISRYRMEKGERASTRRFYILGGVVFAAEFVLLGYYLKAPRLGFAGGVIGAIAAVAPYLVELRIRRSMKQSESSEMIFLFDDDGIEMATQLGGVKHPWDRISTVKMDERGILILIRPIGYFFVPSRA